MTKKPRKVPLLRFKGFTDDWEQRKLGDLAEILRGASPRPIQDPRWFDDDSDVGWLRISDVTAQNGRIHHLEQHISKLGQEKTRVLTSPHLLLSIAATVGKPVVNYVKTGVHDGFLIFYKLKANREFIYQWLEMYRPLWQKYGQPGSQVNLNSDLVKRQVICLPSDEEQQKIVGLLSNLDGTIALHQRKQNLLRKLKQGYLQKLFPKNGQKVPELRFPGFADDWEQRKLGDIYKKNTERNEGQFSEANTISIATMRFNPKGNGASEESLSGYKVLRVGDIAFEGHTSKDFAYGRFVMNDIGDGIMSPRFTTLRPIQMQIRSFWKYYIHYEPLMRKILVKATKSGTMMNELVLPDFYKESVLTPSADEQFKIGVLLTQLDDTIALHQQKIDELQKLKNGYLQKLFV